MDILYSTCDSPVTTALVPVITALVAVIPSSAIYFYVQHRKKMTASIELIRLYALLAQKSTKEWKREQDEILKKISQGNPYGEPNQDYTPLTFYAKTFTLSFEYISEVSRYLNRSEQKKLLVYFDIQSFVDSIIDCTHTTYFRSLTRKRKKIIWELLLDEAENLNKAANEVAKALPRKRR